MTKYIHNWRTPIKVMVFGVVEDFYFGPIYNPRLVPAIPVHVHIGHYEVYTCEQHDDGVRADFGWQQPKRYFR